MTVNYVFVGPYKCVCSIAETKRSKYDKSTLICVFYLGL